MNAALRKAIFRYAFDTRCRNLDVRRVLARFGGASILDAGCGEHGLAAYMPGARITGVDILPEDSVDQRLDYKRGSILELPFADASFDIAASVDVIEHLPEELRKKAVSELVRISRKAVVIAFPSGHDAREIDEKFGADLERRGAAKPEWLEEHLAQAYPEDELIIGWIHSEAESRNRKASISLSYSEPLTTTASLRAWSLKSKWGYLVSNLVTGILRPLMPRGQKGKAYRSIILAEFSDA